MLHLLCSTKEEKQHLLLEGEDRLGGIGLFYFSYYLYFGVCFYKLAQQIG